jgi:hypothetical protein
MTMGLLTRIRVRSIGSHSHGRTAPPLPPAGDRCTETTGSGARCKLPAWRDGKCRLHAARCPVDGCQHEPEDGR